MQNMQRQPLKKVVFHSYSRLCYDYQLIYGFASPTGDLCGLGASLANAQRHKLVMAPGTYMYYYYTHFIDTCSLHQLQYIHISETLVASLLPIFLMIWLFKELWLLLCIDKNITHT